MISYRNLFVALAKAKIRYLVAGGVAVNLHQVIRATADLDLIVHLERGNVLKFANVMTKLGYKPKVPVDAKDFADPKKRKEWIEKKNMRVFSFINPSNVFEVIDIFVQEPKPFTSLDRKKMKISAFGVTIPVIGLEDLIVLKKEAGRDKDLFDVGQLKMVKK